jgi:hypothetical protein
MYYGDSYEIILQSKESLQKYIGKFLHETTTNSDSGFTCLGYLGHCLTNRITSISAVSPKVAKASKAAVSVYGDSGNTKG